MLVSEKLLRIDEHKWDSPLQNEKQHLDGTQVYHSTMKWLSCSNNHIKRTANHQIRLPKRAVLKLGNIHGGDYLRILQREIRETVQKYSSFMVSDFINIKCRPCRRMPLVETLPQVFCLTSLIWLTILSHSIKKSILLATTGHHSRVYNALPGGKSLF